jgi:hypothetical protein
LLQRRQLRKRGYSRSALLLRNELLLKRLEEEVIVATEKAVTYLIKLVSLTFFPLLIVVFDCLIVV